jgi:hypothetical protein
MEESEEFSEKNFYLRKILGVKTIVANPYLDPGLQK